VDQVVFIQQGGRNRHDHICESLELFAREVMPGFQERHPERERLKRERLAPVVEAALARKRAMPEVAEDEIPEIKPYPRELPTAPR
jgi:hypothetical protein